MKRTNALVSVFATSAIALIGLTAVYHKPWRAAEAPPKVGVSREIFRMDRDGRHNALISRYERNVLKLDSLSADTAALPAAERRMAARLLREARTRRDHTQYALELLGKTDTVDPAAWEVARAHARDSLDSLERYVGMAEAEAWRSASQGPPPSPALIEAAKDS